METKYLKINPADNVAVAIVALPAGEKLIVDGKEIVLNARRQGGDCLISVTGGDAPHIGAAALCADGETRRLDRNGHREGELAAELAERAASKLGCCVCAVCGIHFDGITRAEIVSVVAAVRDMADTWLGSASHH